MLLSFIYTKPANEKNVNQTKKIIKTFLSSAHLSIINTHTHKIKNKGNWVKILDLLMTNSNYEYI